MSPFPSEMTLSQVKSSKASLKTTTIHAKKLQKEVQRTFFVGGLSGYVTEYEHHSFFQGSDKTSYVKIPPGEGFGFAQLENQHARPKIPGRWAIFGTNSSEKYIYRA